MVPTKHRKVLQPSCCVRRNPNAENSFITEEGTRHWAQAQKGLRISVARRACGQGEGGTSARSPTSAQRYPRKPSFQKQIESNSFERLIENRVEEEDQSTGSVEPAHEETLQKAVYEWRRKVDLLYGPANVSVRQAVHQRQEGEESSVVTSQEKAWGQSPGKTRCQ